MPQVAALTAAFCKTHRPLSALAKYATGVLPAKHSSKLENASSTHVAAISKEIGRSAC